jgi:hypothetical protein
MNVKAFTGPLIFLCPLLLYCEQTYKVFPTAVYGSYKEEKLPIYAVEGKYGLSKHNGKTVKLLPQRVAVERSDYYNPGYVEISEAEFKASYKAKLSMETTERISGPNSFFEGQYSATIKVTGALKNAYVVALCIPKSALGGETRTLDLVHVSFKQLPNLKDGEEHKLKIYVGFVPEYYGIDNEFILMPIFYSEGYEIRSSISSDIYSYFRKQEIHHHRAILAEYLENNAGKTLKFTPFIRFLPYLTPEAYERQGPIRTTAVLTVEKSGEVRSVELALEDPDSEVAGRITDGLEDWLFLPPLEEGVAKPFQIRIPIGY